MYFLCSRFHFRHAASVMPGPNLGTMLGSGITIVFRLFRSRLLSLLKDASYSRGLFGVSRRRCLRMFSSLCSRMPPPTDNSILTTRGLIPDASGAVPATARPTFSHEVDFNFTRRGRGPGLTSMEERVRLVNGTIVIDSKPTGGTTIHARVPFRSQRAEQATGCERCYAECFPSRGRQVTCITEPTRNTSSSA